MKAHDFVPSKRLGYLVVITTGASILAAGIVASPNWATDARAVGGILLVAGLIRWAVRPAFIAQRDLFATGYQQGYDQGYNEGRRSDRPIVVHMADYQRASGESDAATPR